MNDQCYFYITEGEEEEDEDGEEEDFDEEEDDEEDEEEVEGEEDDDEVSGEDEVKKAFIWLNISLNVQMHSFCYYLDISVLLRRKISVRMGRWMKKMRMRTKMMMVCTTSLVCKMPLHASKCIKSHRTSTYLNPVKH